MRPDPIRFRLLRWFGAIFGLALLSACGQQEPTPTPLKLVKVFQFGDAMDGLRGDRAADSGRWQGFRDPSALVFDAPGRVMAVLVQSGQSVAAGQALMRLDPRDLALSESAARAQLLAAQAELAVAESDFRRYSELHAKGFISQAEHQRRQSQIELARARFESISDQLGYITLRAIEPGVVQALFAKEGALIEARQLMVRLTLASPGVAVTRKDDARAFARAPAGTGMRIPLPAVVEGGYVYRIQATDDRTGVLEKVAVTLGAIDEQSAEVVSGLVRGDRIVAAGTHVLSPQERVRLR